MRNAALIETAGAGAPQGTVKRIVNSSSAPGASVYGVWCWLTS